LLREQVHNRWWRWENGTWEPMEIEEVRLAKHEYDQRMAKAQKLIDAAVKFETIDPALPTNDVKAELVRTYALRHRAHAMLCIHNAKETLLKAVLEAHGNIDWPMVE